MSEMAGALRQLLQAITQSRNDKSGVTVPSHDDLVQTMTLAMTAISSEDEYVGTVWPAMTKLGVYVHELLTTQSDTEYLNVLMGSIVQASRDETVVWTFGHGHHDSAYHKKAMYAESPDSILEVMRRIITLNYAAPSTVIEMAMRVIANSCADKKANQELIVYRDGIPALINLGQHGARVAIIIPTLWNICISCEDQDLSLSSFGSDNDINSILPISSAILQLANAHNMNADFSTFELLMTWGSEVEEEDIWPFLVDLIQASTEPARNGIEHVRLPKDNQDKPWEWTFSVNGKYYDTVDLLVRSCQRAHDEATSDSVFGINQAIFNLLAQPAARAALLRREDDSIWRILICCVIAEEPEEDEDTGMTVKQLHNQMMKLLYQITGEPSFSQSKTRSLSLMAECISVLEQLSPNQDDSDEEEYDEGEEFEDDGNDWFWVTASCVILAQLAASEYMRGELIQNHRLYEALKLLFQQNQAGRIRHNLARPEALYPAVILVSRLALTPDQELPLFETGVLNLMRRFLTQGGLGLTIPYETVITYTLSLRGRPKVALSFLKTQNREISIIDGVFTLWNHTIEAGTKLEIGKLLLELFRTMMPVLSNNVTQMDVDQDVSHNQFAGFLTTSAHRIAEIFAWICMKAEPPTQRDHGWFGLAMLSYWTEGTPGILHVLSGQEDFRTAMLNLSVSPNGPVRQNLMAMLNELQKPPRKEMIEMVRSVLQTAASNTGLNAKY